MMELKIKNNSNYMIILASFFLLVLSPNIPAAVVQPLVRIKDIAHLSGVRNNQLIGTGLVIGLDGTGDKTTITSEMVNNTMRNLGMKIPSDKLSTKNAAAVIITANFPPFTTPGDQIDVTVSTMGDASSLKGGVLLQTPLKGADGVVYAVAQGPLSIGGGELQAASNHRTVAKIPRGAIVENELPMKFVENQHVHYILNNKDFTTAHRIADLVNETWGLGSAKALNSAKVRIKIPYSYQNSPVEFVSQVDNLKVIVDQKARVVINERTGTVVFGGNVKISPVAIAHKQLIINVGNKLNKTGTPETLMSVDNGGTVEDLVNTLNLMGVGTRDLIAIIQEIKNSGALQAELEIL